MSDSLDNIFPINLDWNDISKQTFKIKLYPYFNETPCSVYLCEEHANHVCKYSLDTKAYSKLYRKMMYYPGVQRKFHLCNNHAHTKYLDLKYNPSLIVKI